MPAEVQQIQELSKSYIAGMKLLGHIEALQHCEPKPLDPSSASAFAKCLMMSPRVLGYVDMGSHSEYVISKARLMS